MDLHYWSPHVSPEFMDQVALDFSTLMHEIVNSS